MSVFPILHMEAEKTPKKVGFPFGAFMVQNEECSARLWSFNFLSKLIRAANCVRLCQNSFCREVKS